MMHLRLPAIFQRDTNYNSQLEAIYLVHAVARWVFDVVAAALAVWLLVLMASLLGWAFWGLFWLARRPCRARAQLEQQRSPGMNGHGDG
jgi:hypothetical protein